MVTAPNEHLLPEGQSELPAEEDMNRDDALRAFVAAVNLVEPEHSILNERLTDITPQNVDYGVTRRYYARCGPRSEYSTPTERILVSYSTRLTYINNISRERHLAICAHEMSHLNRHSGRDEEHGAHTNRFWDEYAFNSSELRDAVSTGNTVFGEVDEEKLCEEIITDPNSSTVDRRRTTVDKVKEHIAKLIGEPNFTFSH